MYDARRKEKRERTTFGQTAKSLRSPNLSLRAVTAAKLAGASSTDVGGNSQSHARRTDIVQRGAHALRAHEHETSPLNPLKAVAQSRLGGYYGLGTPVDAIFSKDDG